VFVDGAIMGSAPKYSADEWTARLHAAAIAGLGWLSGEEVTVRARLNWVLLATALGAGCAGSRPIPPWAVAPAIQSPDCIDLAGTYAERGERDEATSYYGTPWTLSRMVIPRFLTGTTRVTIDFPSAHQARFVAWMDSSSLAERSVALGEQGCDCVNGILTLPKSSQSNDAMVGTEKTQITLRRGADGELVASLTTESRGLAYLIVPTWGTSTEWYRFARMEGP
jgi:hypothetical protein